MAMTQKIRPDLSGVPETMLWPLWNRAAEARRIGGLLDDPLSVDLVRRIDYPFFRKFGVPTPYLAIRARYVDGLIQNFLQKAHANPVVIALGEGLETQLWRIGAEDTPWISVDLPESIAVRQRLLPSSDMQTFVPGSAFDEAWMDFVPSGATPFISAAGLLMYFEEKDVRKLLTMVASRFPGATLFFDAIPPAFSIASWNGVYVTQNYRAPRMPWGIRIRDIPGFVRSIPGCRLLSSRTYGEAFPFRTPIGSGVSRLPGIRGRVSPSLNLIKFD